MVLYGGIFRAYHDERPKGSSKGFIDGEPGFIVMLNTSERLACYGKIIGPAVAFSCECLQEWEGSVLIYQLMIMPLLQNNIGKPRVRIPSAKQSISGP